MVGVNAQFQWLYLENGEKGLFPALTDYFWITKIIVLKDQMSWEMSLLFIDVSYVRSTRGKERVGVEAKSRVKFQLPANLCPFGCVQGFSPEGFGDCLKHSPVLLMWFDLTGLWSQMPVIHLILLTAEAEKFIPSQESHRSWIIIPWCNPIALDCPPSLSLLTKQM